MIKRNADEARSYFARVGTDLVTHLAQLSSVAQELTLTERLHIFRDFFKAGEQAAAEFNIHELDQGHNSLWGCLPHLRMCLIGVPHQKQKQPVTGCTEQDFFTVHNV